MSNFPDLLISFDEAVEALKIKLSQDASKSTTYNGEVIQSIAKDLDDKWAAIQALVDAALVFETKALMDAYTPTADAEGFYPLAKVWNDAEASNGIYGWTGSQWNKSSMDSIERFTPQIRQGQGSNAMLGIVTAELLGLFFDRDSRQVYRVTNTLTTRPSLSSTFSGWAQPIAFNGQAFDMLWTKLRAEDLAGENQPIECRVWSPDGKTLAQGTGFLNKSDECWIALDTAITTEQVNQGDPLYIGFWVSEGLGRLMPYNTTGYTPDLPGEQYPTKYTTNSASYDKTNIVNWVDSSTPTSKNQHIQCFSSDSITANNQYADLPSIKQNTDNLLTAMGAVTTNTWDSIFSVVSPLTQPSDENPSSDVFGGWACSFNKTAGLSFNAIQMYSLAVEDVSETWPLADKFRLEIRENSLTGNLLAYSEFSVGLASNYVYGITWLLLDPATHQSITLDETSLSDVYVISVRGLTKTGENARCGYSEASMPNFAGSSWYWRNTSNTWLSHANSPSMAFEHRLASNPSISTTYDYLGKHHLEGTELYQDWHSCFSKFDDVNYDSADSINTYTPSPGALRDRPFVGWGVDLDVPIASFNSLSLPDVRQKSDLSESDVWDAIHVVVKDVSLGGVGEVIAVGQVFVDSGESVLQDVLVALRDPITNELITVTPDMFSGATFGIGYVAYGSSGQTVPIGEMRGSSENFAGKSWYTTSGASWASFAGNPNMAIGLHYLHGLQSSFSYRLNPDVKLPRVDDDITGPTRNVDLYMPPSCYALDSLQCNVYFDNLTIPKYELFEWNVDGGVGLQQEERFTYTPSSQSAKSDHAITIKAIDAYNGEEMAKVDFTLRQADSNGGSGLTRNCIVVGDSTTNAGKYTQRVVALSDADVMSVNLQGTRGSGENQHEGRGGWRVAQYNGPGSPFYRFEVAGITTPPNINSTEYDHNGSRFKVQEYQLDDGVGFFNCEWISGTNEPLVNGTLTKAFGAGDESVAFSSWSETTANPFWNPDTQAFDFAFYMSVNDSFTMGYKDWIFFHLGINDIFGQTSDSGVESIANQAVQHYNTMLASIWTYNSSIRIGMMVTIPPAYYQSAFGSNYNNGQTRARYKRNIQIWNRIMMTEFGGRESDANAVFLVPVNVNVSPVYGFPRSESAAHSHTTETIDRWTNGVHPSDEGYNQMGDALWSFLKYHE